MTARTVVDVSPSMDGYVAGPGVSVERPFGEAGHRLHRWLGFEGTEPEPADEDAARAMFADCGAVLLGRTMYDVGIGTWGEAGAFGVPCFVVTGHAHETVRRGPTTFAFVTDGVARALDRAREAAGDREVVVAGGATLVQQLLQLGLVDGFRLHVVPVLLGGGTSLFGQGAPRELTVRSTMSTAHATHLTLDCDR